ncbi:GGDEF domain-containing protein [Defluviitalea saccharophila]|uniref:GGDEF domain-containing protein n=1 Tax=Defluviitalea saccharophila TaxID=879970 RepID=A0ABZ2Y7J7_9FIRM
MGLDVRTLTIIIMIVILISCFVMIALWIVYPSERGIESWALSASTGAVAFIALTLQPILGSYAVFLNNAGILASSLILLEGILRFRGFGNESHRRHPFIFFLLLFIVVSYFNRNYPTARYLFHDFFVSILLTLSSFFIIYKTHGMEILVHSIAGGSIFILVPIFTFRWYLALSGRIETMLIGSTQHPIMQVLFLFVIPWAVGWTYGLSLVIGYRIQQKLNMTAIQDELTGLGNRRRLVQIMDALLKECESVEEQFFMFMLDLNGFKKINDQYGHSIGDDILVLAAKGIRESIESYDFAVRFGGDEFIVLYRYQDGRNIDSLLNRLRNSIEQIRMLNGAMVQIRTSIGVAVCPDDGTTLDELLCVADKRMYKDKQERKLVSEIMDI